MKIGILTFHWATNYGAVLQAYALQDYLISDGHEVQVINYKPKRYDISLRNIIKHPLSVLQCRKLFVNYLKEKKLQVFRDKYMHLTKRFFNQEEVASIVGEYDVLISGSDQILNPFFTMKGEGCNTSTYFLYFPNTFCQKIGYAVSFGCMDYPSDARRIAEIYIQSFDKLGVREDSGLNILTQLKYGKNAVSTPDPTILKGISLFSKIDIKDYSCLNDYICVYMIRRNLKVSLENSIIIDDVHNSYSMEEWLGLIRCSKVLVTNSYHGMIMALLFHVPFVVDIETNNGVGMNDRFYTLLSRVDLLHRIANGNLTELIQDREINWNKVDDCLSAYRSIGELFLKF